MAGGDGFRDHPADVVPQFGRAFSDMGISGDDPVAGDAVPAPSSPFGVAIQQHGLTENLLQAVNFQDEADLLREALRRLGFRWKL